MAWTNDDAIREGMARMLNRIIMPAFTKAYQPQVKIAVDGAITEVFKDASTIQALYHVHGNIEDTTKTMNNLFRHIEYRLKASGTCPLDEIAFAFSMVDKGIAGEDPGRLDRLFFQ